MIDLNNINLGWLLVGCCVIPVLVLTAFFVVLIRNSQRWLTPDENQLRADYERMRAEHPNANPQQFVNRIIHRQAVRSGLVGAITSVGGLPLLPIGLIIDMYSTTRIQSATLHFIGWALGARSDAEILNLSDSLVLRQEDVTNFVLARAPGLGQRLSRQILELLAEKAFAKLIPGLGLIIGFAVNYFVTRGISRVAAEYYTRMLSAPRR
jgi:hypothetical protein